MHVITASLWLIKTRLTMITTALVMCAITVQAWPIPTKVMPTMITSVMTSVLRCFN